jgi:hypothetical protein
MYLERSCQDGVNKVVGGFDLMAPMERAPSKMGWLTFSKTISIILSSCSRFRSDWQVVDTVAPGSVMLLQMVRV